MKREGVTPHGTYNGYTNYRCRCKWCNVANREYEARRRLLASCPPNPDGELLNEAVFRARLLTWKAVYEAGCAVAVCDEIIRNRPVPARLYAAVQAIELEAAA